MNDKMLIVICFSVFIISILMITMEERAIDSAYQEVKLIFLSNMQEPNIRSTSEVDRWINRACDDAINKNRCIRTVNSNLEQWIKMYSHYIPKCTLEIPNGYYENVSVLVNGNNCKYIHNVLNAAKT